MDQLEQLRTSLADRYAIEREIGRGGMATVYLADDKRHGRKVAIKLMQPEISAGMGPERFLREIQVAAKLSHPHIVALYDSGNVDGHLYYVMPYIEGESLRQRLDKEGQLPIDVAVGFARAIAAALDHAHQRGVVHRDIKPENILLYEGEAMVADFGIALALSTAADERTTGTGIVLGTPAYMSPEQGFGEPADARSDQYSLGCLLFEMLTGELPHTGRNAQSIMAKRLASPPPSARSLRAAVPANVDAAVTKMLAREPVDRFASLAQFITALSAPAAPRVPSIAVLPFRTLGTSTAPDDFADGITEDVIAHLAKLRALKVISSSSVMKFKARLESMSEISAALGATALLDGSIRRAGDRVRIVAQLIDATSEQSVWAETYDRQLTDIFAIQTDVALQIANALNAELSVDEQRRVQRVPTTDVQAYQLFLQGRRWQSHFTTESLNEAIGCYERALARDPLFALASANIAVAYIEMAEQGMLEPGVAFTGASKAAGHALRVDPMLGAAHLTTGYLKMVRDYDWPGAEAEFKHALELSPSNADGYDLYGRLLSALGRFDEAITMLTRAQELDPLAHRLDLATTMIRAGRYKEATRRASDAVSLLPGHDRALATLGWAYFLSGRKEEGLAQLESAVATSPKATLWLAQLGELHALAGNEERAREILHTVEERSRTTYVSPYHFAYIHTGLGEKEKAIDWLEKAWDARTGSLYGIKTSFLFAPLRGHPRFEALLDRMRLND